jgi:hypothetical protein
MISDRILVYSYRDPQTKPGLGFYKDLIKYLLNEGIRKSIDSVLNKFNKDFEQLSLFRFKNSEAHSCIFLLNNPWHQKSEVIS